MQKNKKGFTLIELMIVIALIGLVFLMFGNINFNYMSDRQKSEQFANKIIAMIEQARNDAMIGRSVKSGGVQIIPEVWKVAISKSKVDLLYYSIELTDPTTENYSGLSSLDLKNFKTSDTITIPPNGESILNICNNPDTTETSIYFIENNSYIDSSDCSAGFEIVTAYNNTHDYKITFDPVTQLVTKELQ